MKNVNPPDPHTLAVTVLAFLVAETDRLTRFFALTGLDPATLREIAATPTFARALLSYLGSDEALLVAFARAAGLDPAEVGEAARLADGEAL